MAKAAVRLGDHQTFVHEAVKGTAQSQDFCLAGAEEKKSDPRCRGAYPLITAPSLFCIQILMTC